MRAHRELHAGAGELPVVLDHPLVCAAEPALIRSQRRLDALIEDLRRARSFGFDTEFIGEGSYFTRTCLIQVATPDLVALIDPLCGLDLAGIWGLLVDPSVRTIVHAGTPDLELALRHTGTPARGVFDTQIASAFCGGSYPASLRSVVESLTDARLGPGLKFSQWDQRPLSDLQLRYAGDDVRYLPLLHDELVRRLEALGNLDWALEECRRLEHPRTYAPNPHARRLKARGSASLSHRQRFVLRRLIEWREEAARLRDVSPRSLIPDEGLLALASERPRTRTALSRIAGVPRMVKRELGDQLVAHIEGASREPMPPPARRRSLNERQKARVEQICAQSEDLARARSIAPQIVASKKELRQLAGSAILGEQPAPSRLLAGWRRILLAPILTDLGLSDDDPQGRAHASADSRCS